jgi:hypothetical protein
MKIITFANENRGYYNALLQSAKQNRFQVINVGTTKQWKGYMDRVEHYIAFLKTLPSNEVVVVCDAYDVIVLASADECLDKFKNMNTDKVVMATYHSNFFTEKIFGKVETTHYYNNISMGCYMGYVRSLLDLLTSFCKEYKCSANPAANDQIHMTNYYTTKCQSCITPDHGCNVFYEIDLVGDSTFVDYINVVRTTEQKPRPLTSQYYRWDDKTKRLYVEKTKSFPIFLHGNGNANIDLFVAKLSLSPKRERENRGDVHKQYIFVLLGKFLVIALMLVHLIMMYLVNIHVYITKSRSFLFGLIIWNILIVLQWYIFGNCVFTSIENKIQPNTYDDGTEKNFMVALINKIIPNEKVTFYMFSFLPVLSTIVAVYRLTFGSLACKIP